MAIMALYGAQAGMQVLGGFLQAEMVKSQAKIQRQIAEFNAELAEYDAWKVEAAGQTIIARSQSQYDKLQGSAKVSAAATGVKLDGSLSDAVGEQALAFELNKLDIEARAIDQAFGYKRQANQIRSQSDMNYLASQYQASSAITNSLISGAGTMTRGYLMANYGQKDVDTTNDTPSGYSLTNKKTYLNGIQSWDIIENP